MKTIEIDDEYLNWLKSFKLLTPYEKATIWAEIETRVSYLQHAAANQNLKDLNDNLYEINQRVKKLERHSVAEALKA